MTKQLPIILAIDTSCDETSVAITCGRRILSNVISSQVDLHKKYGGVYPALAKRAHQEKIDWVVKEAIRRAKTRCKEAKSQSSKEKNFETLKLCNSVSLSAIAVTQGPGLAIALEVGIKKAKEIIRNPQFVNSQLKLIAVNHLEGHIYSCLAESSTGLPKQIRNSSNVNSLAIQQFNNEKIQFPALCLIVSGGHTQLLLMKNHGNYQLIGETLDDACGEALDKAAKILKLGYPGGHIIEKLSDNFKSASKGEAFRGYILTQPLKDKKNLNFSYSGLKTQFLYLTQKMTEEEFSQNLHNLAFSFQTACFEQVIRKTSQAIKLYQPKTILCGGGVISNKTLKKYLRKLAKEEKIPIFFPPKKNLITDNAAMIGIAAYYKYLRGEFVNNIDKLDRLPRWNL